MCCELSLRLLPFFLYTTLQPPHTEKKFSKRPIILEETFAARLHASVGRDQHCRALSNQMLTIVTTHLHSNLTSHSHFPTAGFAKPETVLLLQASCMLWKHPPHPASVRLQNLLSDKILTGPLPTKSFERLLPKPKTHQPCTHTTTPTTPSNTNPLVPNYRSKTLRIPPFQPKKLIKWHYNILFSIIDAPTTCSSSPSTYWVFYSGNFHSLGSDKDAITRFHSFYYHRRPKTLLASHPHAKISAAKKPESEP